VGLNLQPSSRGPRGVTEMGYPMYPPSLYRAISYGSKLGVPMYITENGTPLTEDTSERSEWISGYLGQVCQCSSKAVSYAVATLYLHTHGMLPKHDCSQQSLAISRERCSIDTPLYIMHAVCVCVCVYALLCLCTPF